MTDSRWPRFAAAALGFLWFLQLGGGRTLNPLTIDWLFSGDWMQHWLGWLYFRNEPWSLPLGTIATLPYPVGTNIAFTDSNPLVALLLKPLSGVLPAEFQFIGPWLAFCFVMQGYMGAALTSTVTKDAGQQVLGGYLFVLSPVLVARMGHDTLCAQWILLGLLYLGLRDYPDGRAARWVPALTTGAVMLAAAIHPYLTAMSWTLALAITLRLWRGRLASVGRALLTSGAITIGMLAVWWVIGYFGDTPDGSYGFGLYSADLLTLVNPRTFSRLLPELPQQASQGEGFGYLGLGGLLAGLVAGVSLARSRPTLRPGIGLIALASLFLGVFALSSSVKMFGQEVLDLRGLYAPFMPIVEPFRSTGRFIWPIHYLALTFGIWGVVRVFGETRQSAATALLAVVVAVQGVDLKADSWWSSPKKFRQVSVAHFSLAQGHYQHLALFPMQVLNVCHDPYEEEHVYRMMLLAYRLKLTYNSGVFARLPAGRIRTECARLEHTVDTGALDRETIFIVAAAEVPRIKNAGASCGRWDGDWICVSRNSNERFRTWIETEKDIGAGR